MKCPYCNNEMQKGYIQCRDGVTWTPKKQWVAAFSSLGAGAVPLGKDNGLSPNSVAEAYHCGTCKKVIIDYSE